MLDSTVILRILNQRNYALIIAEDNNSLQRFSKTNLA